MFNKSVKIADKFDLDERIVVHPGGCLEMLRNCPDELFGLVVTSPPYNIGKEYEKRLELDIYLVHCKI